MSITPPKNTFDVPGVFDLTNAFKNGSIKLVRLVNGQQYQPQGGKRALLLYGTISHVTATDTGLAIEPFVPGFGPAGGDYISLIFYVLAAGASKIYAIPNMDPTGAPTSSGPALWFLAFPMALSFSGDATAWANLAILEW